MSLRPERGPSPIPGVVHGRSLYDEAREVLGKFANHTLAHIRRDENQEADALANQAVDSPGSADEYFHVPN